MLLLLSYLPLNIFVILPQRYTLFFYDSGIKTINIDVSTFYFH